VVFPGEKIVTQLTFLTLAQADKEDPEQVMRELSKSCRDCRLGAVVHPTNRGMIWRGSLQGRVAVIGEAPGDQETERGRPLVGPSGKLWERWAAFMGLDTKTDCFLGNVIQCQPDKVPSREDPSLRSQRPPDQAEIDACFGPRCLRVLRAMPNLEIVITLGWVAAGAFLGGDPKAKTHENTWFKSTLLPGVAFYCLVHPSYMLREPTMDKQIRVQEGLKRFREEYLLKNKDILAIVKQMEEAEALE
jgi:uracil-DNA glycosylase family 4